MRIVLINAIDYENGQRTFEDMSETLGLPYIASYLRSRQNVEVIIAQRDIKWTLERLKPDIVGLSSVTQNFNIAQRYAAEAKALGAAVIIGGVHISCVPSSLNSNMDVAVIGEGEITMAELVNHYKKHRTFTPGEELSKIKGIAFRSEESSVVLTPPRELAILDDLPFPARDLYEHKMRGIITSRGCPYSCRFCFSAHYVKKARYASSDYVVAEIRHIIDNYNPKHIPIYDDLFVANMSRLRRITDILEADGITKQVSFNCNVRPNLATPELAKTLVRMNVINVFLGIESGVQRILEYLKPQNAFTSVNMRALEIFNDYGIKTTAGIIIGSPDETKEDMMATLKFIRQSPLDDFYVLHLTPYPGTPIWEEAIGRGLVSYTMDWSRLRLELNEVENPVIMSKTLTKAELLEIYELFIRERMSLRRRYYFKVLTNRKFLQRLIRNRNYFFCYAKEALRLQWKPLRVKVLRKFVGKA